jgi:hypothetical protein
MELCAMAEARRVLPLVVYKEKQGRWPEQGHVMWTI